MIFVIANRYTIGKTAKERQYSWDYAPVHTKIEPSLRRGIEVLATWFEYRENGKLVRLTAEVKHFYKNINDYIGTTKAIKQPNENLDLKSTQLILLNQQLLELLGTLHINLHNF